MSGTLTIGDTVLIRDTGAHGIIVHDDAVLIGGLGYWVECDDGPMRGYLGKQLEAL